MNTILLYGPEGSGKSMVSYSIVQNSKFNLYELNSSKFENFSLEQSKQIVGQIFKNAINGERIAVLFDQIDLFIGSTGGNQNEKQKMIKEEIIGQMTKA